MDPATIFQFVCGALQLIEFGLGTARAFHEISESKDALTLENTRLDHETKLLHTASSQISLRLQGLGSAHLTPEQAHLQQLALKCQQVAQNLLDRLDKVKVVGNRSKRKIPVQWVRLKLEKEKIDKDEAELRRCRELLDTQMLVTLW